MTRCPRCGTGAVLRNYDDVSCLSCGYDPTSPPRLATAEDTPKQSPGKLRRREPSMGGMKL